MAQVKEQPLVYLLMDQLHAALKEYQESLNKDEIFEVRKRLLERIRALQLEIHRLTDENPINGE